MSKTIKARFHEGRFEPLEPLDLEEGSEVLITVAEPEAAAPAFDPIAATSGAWKDLLDCEQFERDVYESRLIQTRPEVRW
jgi:predicted DNA-binding antitoxin AbrB/MazE fold protein